MSLLRNKKFKVSKTVSLTVNEGEKGEFVPDLIDFKDQKTLIERISLSINDRTPVLLIGETGTGKTSLVRYLSSMTNNGFRRVNHNGGTTVEDIVGKILVDTERGTYWIDGVLIDAMRKGHWYLADEINAASAEINFVYHSLLDDDRYIVLSENNGEIVRPHLNFKFFGAMNPTTEYAGTKEMNKALMSRFAVYKIDFPSPKTEIKILSERTGIKAELASRMVKFAASLRSQHSKQKIDYVFSTRDLIMWAQMFRHLNKYIPSAEMSVLNKVGIDDFDVVKDMLSLNFKSLDEGKDVSDPYKAIEK